MFKIERTVSASKLRGMCIKHNYYTRGTNEDYSNMLLKYNGQPVAETEIEWLAKDIMSHSETTDAEGFDVEVINIAYNILTEACHEYLVET